MDAQHYCESCGSTLEPDSVFCENCGNRVEKPVSVPAVTPPPPRPQPVLSAVPAVAPSPSVEKKQGKSRLIPALGIGCSALICIGVLVIGGYFLLQNRSSSPQEIVAPPQATTIPEVPAEPPIENPPAQATSIPEAEPTEAAPPEPAPTTEVPPPDPPAEIDDGLTGNQRRDETSFFDDFSSKALAWSEFDDGITIIKYEDEAYSLQVTGLDFFDWAYVPVDFSPTSISFDVWGLPGEQDGTFGVMCQFQDVDNYYYVEIDLWINEFTIAQSKAGEYIPLTLVNDVGGYWHKADPLYSSPEQVNRISVECYLDFIVLAINDSLVYHVDVLEPFTVPGEMGLLVYAFSFAGPDGYKVFFDNVEAYWVAE